MKVSGSELRVEGFGFRVQGCAFNDGSGAARLSLSREAGAPSPRKTRSPAHPAPDQSKRTNLECLTRGPLLSSFLKRELLELDLVMVGRVAK